MSQISLIGAGGLGKEIAASLAHNPDIHFLGFYDDASMPHLGNRYLGTIKKLIAALKLEPKEYSLLISIGSPKLKRTVHDRLAALDINYPVFLHPNAHLEDLANIRIGEGSIITSGVQMTTDIEIGKHVLINLNSTIGHDAKIGDFSSLMPGVHISGNVSIGEGVLIGSGAVVLPNLTIGSGSTIGAGAVITRDVASGVVVKGVPAK